MNHSIVRSLIALTLWMYVDCYGQTSDFVVTSSKDTVYVDKINVTNLEVRTKTADKRRNFTIDDIIGYHKANKYYERVPLEKAEDKTPDRYDRKSEDLYLGDYQHQVRYKFIQRLTHGKIKLFAEMVQNGSPGTPNQPGYMAPMTIGIYYISIYDSKLESIQTGDDLKLFDFNKGLELTKEVYDVLKTYLRGNAEINARLDRLFMSKPIAKESQIVDLVNDYNDWAKTNKL